MGGRDQQGRDHGPIKPRDTEYDTVRIEPSERVIVDPERLGWACQRLAAAGSNLFAEG